MSSSNPGAAVSERSASARRRERQGKWLQVVGGVWTVLIGAAVFLLLLLLAFDPLVGGYLSWLVLAGAVFVAIGPILYGIGSWFRGELERPVHSQH